MKEIFVKIAKLNGIRTLLHRMCSAHSDQACREAFIEAMNAQSKKWGMSQTLWINPGGVKEDGRYSHSTARNLATLAMRVFGEMNINHYHGTTGYELNITTPYLLPGHRHRKTVVYSSSPYETIGNNYPIIGSKTGSGDGYQTLVMVCDIKGVVVAGCIMYAKDYQGRFEAMDELMRIADKILHEQVEAKSLKCTLAKNACLLTKDKNGGLQSIFEQNADDESAPMSTTKVMDLAIILRYLHDMNKMEYIIPVDEKGAVDDILHAWDKLTTEDLINAMMRDSSVTAANALARLAGEQILNQQKQRC